MLPDGFKDMFGIKDEADMKMANNIWKMLDDMSSNDPNAYEKFIEKNIKEGLGDAKAEKEKKEKPFKIVPKEYMLLEMDAELMEEVIGESEQDEKFKEKLDMNINKEKWSDVKLKFPSKVRVHLNICHSDRVKNPTSKSKNGEEIKQFNLSMLKDIESLYYSLQGPHFEEIKPQQNWYFCMILNTNFLQSFDTVPNGRKILLSLTVSYFQERIKQDRNPVLLKVNTHSLYGKNLYYGIEKETIEINQERKYKYGNDVKCNEFLLEAEVDVKGNERSKKDKKDEKNEKSDKSIKSEAKPKAEITFKQKEEIETSELPPLVPVKDNKSKKVLIEVLDEKSNDSDDTKISYEMKEDDKGYHFEFLVHGVEKISELDLEINAKTLKLKTINLIPMRSIEINLKKAIDEDNVKAKMKKKTHTLQVSLLFAP